MSRTHQTIIALAATALTAPITLADDLTPPPWRGTNGTTFQHWGFDNPGGGPPDNGLNNPFGTPLFTPNNGASWDPVDPSGQRTGTYVITQNQTLSFEIPNAGQPGVQKELWLQYVYTTIDGLAPQSSVLDPGSGALFTLISSTPTDLGGGLFHHLDVFTYGDCPTNEVVTLAPGVPNSASWIDQVVVDTRCVPTPGSAALLAAAALSARRRRR